MSLRSAALALLACGLIPSALGNGAFLFADISATAGLDFPLTQPRPGAAVADVDGDGLLDICFTGGAVFGPRLYRNNGDRTFTDVSADAFPVVPADLSFASFADLDNDGDPDLVAARRYADWKETGFMTFENVDGVFIPHVPAIDPAYDATSFGGLALTDMDDDGLLDVVYAHNGGSGIGGLSGRGFMLRNEGDFEFSDVTASYGGGIETRRRYWSVVAADFNNDRQDEIHAAVDFTEDFQCRRVAPGAYVDVSEASGVTNTGSDMGLAVADIDFDGDLDIYSTNIYGGVLYMNNGAGVFTNRAANRGVASYIGTGWGVTFTDFDHDRDVDLCFVVQGASGQLFANNGSGFFMNATAGTNLVLTGLCLIPFDLDLDGDQDLLAASNAGYPVLYENRSPLAGKHWLTVQLEGTASNRDAIGARVEATVGDSTSGTVTLIRPIQSNSSFVAGPPKEAHFGLGATRRVEHLRVLWPSGAVTEAWSVRADRYLKLTEADFDPHVTPVGHHGLP